MTTEERLERLERMLKMIWQVVNVSFIIVVLILIARLGRYDIGCGDGLAFRLDRWTGEVVWTSHTHSKCLDMGIIKDNPNR